MTEKSRAKYTDHKIEKSETYHPYCLICGISIEHHPIETMPTSDEIQSIDTRSEDGEKIWWDDEKQEYNTIDYAIEKQWKNRLQTMREKSVAGINFSDALATVIDNGEFRTLSDEQQCELIQAWLYPTNDEGEIETRSEDEIREQLWEDDDSVETDEWYRQRASDFEFHPILTTCGYCNEREACYNGITSGCYDAIDNKTHNGVIFQFCKICRDELQMIKLQTLASRP